MRANMSGEEIDIQSELKQFETDQQAKRNVCTYICTYVLHDSKVKILKL